jgi:hypothetical protein
MITGSFPISNEIGLEELLNCEGLWIWIIWERRKVQLTWQVVRSISDLLRLWCEVQNPSSSFYVF